MSIFNPTPEERAENARRLELETAMSVADSRWRKDKEGEAANEERANAARALIAYRKALRETDPLTPADFAEAHTKTAAAALARLCNAGLVDEAQGRSKGGGLYPFSVRLRLPSGDWHFACEPKECERLANIYAPEEGAK